MLFWIFLFGLCVHAEPSKSTVLENQNRKIERFFLREELEYKKIATNQKGWNGVSRGYFSTALYEDEVVSSTTMKSIYKTWNIWSVLPNLKITKSEDVYQLLKANRGALYLPHFDLSLLEECPEMMNLQEYLQAKSLSKDAITALKTHKNRIIHAYIESDTTCGSDHYSHFKNEYCDYLYEIEQEQRYEEEQRRRMEEE